MPGTNGNSATSTATAQSDIPAPRPQHAGSVLGNGAAEDALVLDMPVPDILLDAPELTGPEAAPGQAVSASAIAKFHAPEIVFGAGSLAELGHSARRVGARKPFLVTDPGLIEAGWVGEATFHLRHAGLTPEVWSTVTPNPKDHEVQAAYEQYAAADCDVIVAVGGGSCIDAAKGVAILSGNGGTILGYEGVDRVVNPLPPMVMAPSTSGTGADVSQFAIISDTANLTKITIISRSLVPDISIVDPRLLTTMPNWLNAATGLDALTHAIEAFVSLAHNTLTDHYALHAVQLVSRHLLDTMQRPRHAGARTGMAQASLEAGMAFTNAILGATHAMSHQVGGLLDAPHGVINGVLLDHVIRFNAATAPQRYVPLAVAAGIETSAMSPVEAAHALADRVRALADSVGVPRGLTSLGVTEADLPRLAKSTLKDACLSTNPREADVVEIESLFRLAM